MKLTWWGNVVWTFSLPPTTASEGAIHHDVRKIWNKKLKDFTYIFVGGVQHTAAEAQALGAKGPYASWSPEAMYEVNRNHEIVWKWEFTDHLCQNFDPTKPNYVTDVSTLPNRLDVNVYSNPNASKALPTSGALPQDWTHCNSLDYNQDLDLITINSRNLNEFYIIDHGKTFVQTTKDPVTGWQANINAAAGPDGDFIYRFGCPSNYNQGALPGWATNGSTQLWGPHNIQWIRKNEWPQNNWNNPNKGPALPGAGHLLVFDNGSINNNPLGATSKVDEINPYISGPPVNGVYPTSPNFVNPPQAGYSDQVCVWTYAYGPEHVSNQIVWRFVPLNESDAASQNISGMQRLPNGNTFVDSGNQGHLFEVTSAGELVWEYIVPLQGATIMTNSHNVTGMPSSRMVYRASRWSANHPAFRNRVVQYSDGTIQPIQKQAGVGFTLTGRVPCRTVPCQYVGSP